MIINPKKVEVIKFKPKPRQHLKKAVQAEKQLEMVKALRKA